MTIGRQIRHVRWTDQTDSGSQTVRTWTPQGVANPAPLLLWCHPYSQTEAITPSYFAYPLIHAAVQEGWMFAAMHQHGDPWGNDTGLTDVVNAYNLVNGQNPVSSVILVGASMGGLSAALTVARANLPAGKVKGVIAIDAVFDINNLYTVSTTFQSGINGAYGITSGTLSAAMASTGLTSMPTTASFPTIGTVLTLGAGTANVEQVTTTGASSGTAVAVTATTKTHASGDVVSDMPSKTSNREPLRSYSASAYTGVSWRFYASTGDTSVTKASNTDAMAALVAAAPEAAVLTRATGHLSPTGYLVADQIAYVKRCLAR